MPKQIDPNSNYTKGALKLIATAEKLFGEYGIEGVSLRQIVTAAGLVNSYSIQHHFGSKEGLVQAVYDFRIPALEAGCRERFKLEQDSEGNISIHGLLASRFLPMIDSFNDQIQKTYSLFLLRLLFRSNAVHPYFRSKVPQPATTEIVERLRNSFPKLPMEVFNTRFRLATDLFLGAMVEKKRLSSLSESFYKKDQFYWDEILQAMESIFCMSYNGKKHKNIIS